MTAKTRFILWLLISTFLTGCLFGPDFEVPHMELPSRFREGAADTQRVANLPWWELYNEKELVALITNALRNNQDLQLALGRVEEAKARLVFTTADLFPALGLGGNLQRLDSGRDTPGSSQRSYSLFFPLSWEIDLWGRIRRSREAEKANLFAGEYFYRAATLSLVAEVASAYFLLLDTKNRLAIAANTLAGRTRSTALIKARFKEGYVAKIDLHQAEVQQEIAAALVNQFRREVRQVENALAVLLGGFSQEVKVGKPLLEQKLSSSIPVGLPSDLLTNRPDVLALREQVHARYARIGVAEALRFPSLSLTTALGIQSPALSEFNYSTDRFWRFGGELVGPLLSANKNVSRVEIEEALASQAVAAYRNGVLTAFREVEDALIAVTTLWEEYKARSRQVDSGEQQAFLSRARYEGGQTAYLEVLDSERSLFESQLQESIAYRQYLISLVNLFKVLGGGWRPHPESVRGNDVSAEREESEKKQKRSN